MTNARFEIRATLPPGASADQIPEMLQALLAERFKLELRHEMKEQNVYSLVVGNGGAKLKPAERKADNNSPMALGPDGKPREPMILGFLTGGVSVKSASASLASLVGLMARFTAKPVVDMTGIEGQYEFSLFFAPEIVDPAVTKSLSGVPTAPVLEPDGVAISAPPCSTP